MSYSDDEITRIIQCRDTDELMRMMAIMDRHHPRLMEAWDALFAIPAAPQDGLKAKDQSGSPCDGGVPRAGADRETKG